MVKLQRLRAYRSLSVTQMSSFKISSRKFVMILNTGFSKVSELVSLSLQVFRQQKKPIPNFSKPRPMAPTMTRLKTKSRTSRS